MEFKPNLENNLTNPSSAEEELYRKKYLLLLDRCQKIQEENEELVKRYQQSKIMYRKTKVDIMYLKNKLFHYNDIFGHELNISVHPNRADWAINKIKLDDKKYLSKRAKSKQPATNLLKKPVNKFIIFCREEKKLLKENRGDPRLSKMEIMRLLTLKWKMMSKEEKQVYESKYEKLKKAYEIELEKAQFHHKELDKKKDKK